MTIYGLAVFSLVYALAVASPGPGVAAVVARFQAHMVGGRQICGLGKANGVLHGDG